MYTRMLVQVRQYKNAEMYNASAKCSYQTQKNEENKEPRPTKLTKEKLATKRGNKPQAPLAREQKSQAQVVC